MVCIKATNRGVYEVTEASPEKEIIDIVSLLRKWIESIH